MCWLLLYAIALQETHAQEECPSAKAMFCTTKMDITLKSAFVKSYKPFLCDAETDGGRWIVIQRRVHKDTSFNRNWTDYKNGFGTTCTDYWLGNDLIHEITALNQFELRFDMTYKGNAYYATYKNFKVGNEASKYIMTIGEFTGNVSNNFITQNSSMFSTPDRDNDAASGNCAGGYQAGWWYKACHMTNLNGHFDTSVMGKGVIWYSVTTDYDSLSSVEMKIRKMS
ncbi:ficolin-1-like [Biomphalaria glabrata]|uniref:Ficolin-1-like n=1 Tax=Biomphalaria glabrata TaxID=6526 RepID=A0A9W3AJL2_BIOGL|nr:ficolin-1-like [Biomphalaria glabrata]